MPTVFFPPAAPPPPRASELSFQLQTAILNRDTAAARKVFDIAFWEKVEFKPDSHHLLQAVLKGDRQMVTLLTSFGAGWTEDEAKLARGFIEPADWKTVEGALRNAGIRTQYTPEEIKQADLMVVVRWSHRSLLNSQARGMTDTQKYRDGLETLLRPMLANAGLKGDMNRAKEILLYRDPKSGVGTAGDPLDLSKEFSLIIEQHILSKGRTALKFLDAFLAGGFRIKPLEVDSVHLILSPTIVTELDKRGLVAKDSPAARRSIIGEWASLQEEIELGGMPFVRSAEDVAQQNESLKAAAGVLFGTGHPATEQEAESFIRLHGARAKTAPFGLANAERQLLELGFFDSPAWTADRLRRLMAAGDLKDDALKTVFNGKAARAEMLQATLPKVLNPKKLFLIEDAHKSGAWKANSAETLKIVDYLAGEIKKDKVPDEFFRTLKAMKDGGADFSRIDPSKYLGRNAPGLAKTLLDTGAVRAEDFDVEGVSRKVGGEMNLVIEPGKPGHAYNEFLCLLILEITEAAKYTALRGTPGLSYQKQFINEWQANPSFKNGITVSYRKRTPPPPAPKF